MLRHAHTLVRDGVLADREGVYHVRTAAAALVAAKTPSAPLVMAWNPSGRARCGVAVALRRRWLTKL